MNSNDRPFNALTSFARATTCAFGSVFAGIALFFIVMSVAFGEDAVGAVMGVLIGGLLFAAGGFVVACGLVGAPVVPRESIGGGPYMKLAHLEPDETISGHSWGGYHDESSGGAVSRFFENRGGLVCVTPTRIVFVPIRFKWDASVVPLAIDDIATVTPRTRISLTSLARRSVAVRMRDGREHTFWVSGAFLDTLTRIRPAA